MDIGEDYPDILADLKNSNCALGVSNPASSMVAAATGEF
jgi:hypothetical protein